MHFSFFYLAFQTPQTNMSTPDNQMEKSEKNISWFNILHSEGETRKGNFSLIIQNQPGNINMDSQIPSKSCLRLNGFSESASIFCLSDTAPVFPKPYHPSSQLLFCPHTSKLLGTANATGPGASSRRECREPARLTRLLICPQHFSVILDL